jgi:hypothetical protein
MSQQDYWLDEFPDMRLVNKAPGLATLSGIGTMAYGFMRETVDQVRPLCTQALGEARKTR